MTLTMTQRKNSRRISSLFGTQTGGVMMNDYLNDMREAIDEVARRDDPSASPASKTPPSEWPDLVRKIKGHLQAGDIVSSIGTPSTYKVNRLTGEVNLQDDVDDLGQDEISFSVGPRVSLSADSLDDDHSDVLKGRVSKKLIRRIDSLEEETEKIGKRAEESAALAESAMDLIGEIDDDVKISKKAINIIYEQLLDLEKENALLRERQGELEKWCVESIRRVNTRIDSLILNNDLNIKPLPGPSDLPDPTGHDYWEIDTPIESVDDDNSRDDSKDDDPEVIIPVEPEPVSGEDYWEIDRDEEMKEDNNKKHMIDTLWDDAEEDARIEQARSKSAVKFSAEEEDGGGDDYYWDD